MTIQKLFLYRLKNHFTNTFNTLKLFVDWTVWVYLIIPFSLFGIFQYKEFIQTLPTWIEYVTPTLLSLVLTLFCSYFTLSMYVEEGDLLFLHTKKGAINQLKNYSFLWFIGKVFILVSTCIALLSPILIQGFHFSREHLLLLFIMTGNNFTLYSIVKYLSNSVKMKKWKQLLFYGFTYYLIFFIFQLSISKMTDSVTLILFLTIILIGGNVVLIRYILRGRTRLSNEIDYQLLKENRLGNVALQQTGMLVKENKFKKPSITYPDFFFSSVSNKIMFQSYMRQLDNKKIMFYLILLCIATAFLAPVFITLLGVAYTVWIIRYDYRQQKRAFLEHSFLKQQATVD